MIPPGQRPTSLRPSPVPSNPAPPCRRTAHPVGTGATAHHGNPAPSGHGNPRHPRTQWVPVPGAKRARKPRTQWVPGINRETGGIPQKPGQPRTQWAKLMRFRGRGDSFTFRAGKAKIRDFFKSTRISESPESTPSDKRNNCHHGQKGHPLG